VRSRLFGRNEVSGEVMDWRGVMALLTSIFSVAWSIEFRPRQQRKHTQAPCSLPLHETAMLLFLDLAEWRPRWDAWKQSSAPCTK